MTGSFPAGGFFLLPGFRFRGGGSAGTRAGTGLALGETEQTPEKTNQRILFLTCHYFLLFRKTIIRPPACADMTAGMTMKP
jgi:hypothetical protein